MNAGQLKASNGTHLECIFVTLLWLLNSRVWVGIADEAHYDPIAIVQGIRQIMREIDTGSKEARVHTAQLGEVALQYAHSNLLAAASMENLLHLHDSTPL